MISLKYIYSPHLRRSYITFSVHSICFTIHVILMLQKVEEQIEKKGEIRRKIERQNMNGKKREKDTTENR